LCFRSLRRLTFAQIARYKRHGRLRDSQELSAALLHPDELRSRSATATLLRVRFFCSPGRAAARPGARPWAKNPGCRPVPPRDDELAQQGKDAPSGPAGALRAVRVGAHCNSRLTGAGKGARLRFFWTARLVIFIFCWVATPQTTLQAEVASFETGLG